MQKERKRRWRGMEEMERFSEWGGRKEAVGERRRERIHWAASEHCLIFDMLSPSCTVWLNSFLLVYSLSSSPFFLERWEDERRVGEINESESTDGWRRNEGEIWQKLRNEGKTSARSNWITKQTGEKAETDWQTFTPAYLQSCASYEYWLKEHVL